MKSVRKVSTGQGDNYTTGYLLDVAYSKKKLQTNCSWFKQAKSFKCRLKSHSKDFFNDKANKYAMIYYILEQSEEITLQFSKGTTENLSLL